MIEGTIPTRTARLIRDAAMRTGVPPGELAVDPPPIDPTVLGDDLLRVPTSWVMRTWELMDAAVGPRAGLLAAETADRGALYVWDYLFTSESTLAQSLRAVVDLRGVVTDPTVDWQVIESGGLLSIRDTVPTQPEHILAPVQEFLFSVILRRVREATHRRLIRFRVAFSHNASHRYSHLIDGFGTSRIDFGAPYAELTFLDAGALPTGSDPHLGAMLRHYSELFLTSSRPIPNSHDILRTAIIDALRQGDLSLETVAGRLATSPRTLQRRLRDLGTSWREEVETVRYETATNLIRNTTLPFRSIAARIGYTDPRAFRRSFQRWTGQQPKDFRRSLGSEPTSMGMTRIPQKGAVTLRT
ncbi:helix-turn-helix domain-containing protein [Nocardia sp. NPDC059229]|uniref:helix-turn-helix domain-containing protein n=1 Tax=Nocardia sp. NPDC059229 TaxID=3346778 RepID=UPI00367C3070